MQIESKQRTLVVHNLRCGLIASRDGNPLPANVFRKSFIVFSPFSLPKLIWFHIDSNFSLAACRSEKNLLRAEPANFALTISSTEIFRLILGRTKKHYRFSNALGSGLDRDAAVGLYFRDENSVVGPNGRTRIIIWRGIHMRLGPRIGGSFPLSTTAAGALLAGGASGFGAGGRVPE